MNVFPVFITNALLARLGFVFLDDVPPESGDNALWMLGLLLIMLGSGVVVNRLCQDRWSVKTQLAGAYLVEIPLMVLMVIYSRFLVLIPGILLMPPLAIWFARRFFDPRIQ